ncbi:MAG: arylamine N-acetyltransferase, partial [Deltaproteobacteria bacterium]|nr:arylamine N-acetyltransferase [Deltaproteobacteria bacterium]
MDTTNYLARIGVDHIEKPGYAYLQKLQLHHLLAVPFENLDIRQGIKIVLNKRNLYEKVVVRHRGGFCYELNGLFCWLLRNMGFSVSMASGRVYIPAEDNFTPEFDHMVLLVQLDKTFLVDVGFGDAFRKPIALPEGIADDISGRYRIKPRKSDPNDYLLEKQEEAGWRPVYSFTTHPRQMSDFEKMCLFHQTSPDSHFTQQTVCTIAREDGRVTLS